MPATINTRPQAIDLEYYPGQAITLTFTFPAGYLSTRTFKAFLGGRVTPGVELTCTEDTDELEVAADASDTTAFDFPAEFTLVPFTAPSTYGDPIFVGTWTPGTEGQVAPTIASYVVRTPTEIAVEVTQTSPPGAAGTNGTNGTDGRTILYGTAAPTTEGEDGDFYIRTTTSFIYGPKAAGVWPAGTSLVGAAGAAGAAGANGTDGADGVVQAIVAGTNVTVDATDPANPVVSASGGGGSGVVETIVAGTNVTVDDTDPANPIVSASGGGGSGVVEAVVAGNGIDVDATDPANPIVAIEAAITTKLSGIEALADVTDATNVAAAGAAMLASGGTFAADIVVPAEAYGAGWNGSNEAPTKNDVYDEIESLASEYAPIGSGMVYIGTVTLGVAAVAMTFSGIPATFKDLWLTGMARTDRAASNLDRCAVQVGSGSIDTSTANYSSVSREDGDTAASTHDTAVGYIRAGACPGSTGTAGFLSPFEVKIFNYAVTGQQRGIIAEGGGTLAASIYRINKSAGVWENTTDAIDTVRIIPITGTNLTAGSHVHLYGLA